MRPHNTQETTNTPRTLEPRPQPPMQMHPADDFLSYMREYARQKPDVVALWCFGVGFVLGWKLKPW